jgi:hypothetical protein
MAMQTVIPSKKQRAARAGNLARQNQERRTRVTGDEIHDVERPAAQSRRVEAADSRTVVTPPTRRWKRASTIPHMPDLPGYSLKWVRVDGRERGDERGVIKHLQEQWEFARKSEFPKYALQTKALGHHGEVIWNGDMVLMKLHEDLLAQRNAVYARKRDRATAATESAIREQITNPNMPLVLNERRSSVQFNRMRGGRRRVSVAGDED